MLGMVLVAFGVSWLSPGGVQGRGPLVESRQVLVVMVVIALVVLVVSVV